MDHRPLALLGIFGDRLADAVEAGDPVTFGVVDAAIDAVLHDFAVLVALAEERAG